MTTKAWTFCGIALWLACPHASAQPAGTPAPAAEAEVITDAVPPEVVASAVDAVTKLGDQVVLGKYKVAIERMNPLWKERTAQRVGGMEALERQLDGVAARMVQEGISMISFKPHGQPRVYQVSPGKRVVRENGVDVERLAYTRWVVLVPTTTTFRMMRPGETRSLVVESLSYQVAISDKGKNDWTFIDGTGLTPADLRGLFGTLPADIDLPPVGKKEVP
jgi:hypothetical protein